MCENRHQMSQPPLTHIMHIIAPINNQPPHAPWSPCHQCLPCRCRPPSQLLPPPLPTAMAQCLQQDLSQRRWGRGGWPKKRLTSTRIKSLLSSLCSYPKTMKILMTVLLLPLCTGPDVSRLERYRTNVLLAHLTKVRC
jgi:hypothetical protein